MSDHQHPMGTSLSGQAASTVPESPAPAPVSERPPRSSRRLLFFWGALALIICGCLGICGIAVGTAFYKSIKETPAIERITGEFMKAMAGRDTVQAYSLFSERAKRTFQIADLEKMLEGNNFILFDEYNSLKIDNIMIKATFNTNPDLPQGVVADVKGAISYNRGFTGTFQALLEEEGENWRLFIINITVPPGKFSPPPSATSGAGGNDN